MNSTEKLIRATACTLAIGASCIALTGQSASAIVTENDEVLITAVGFDVGGSGFASGAPTNGADVEWDQGWYGVQPTLSGTIHFQSVAGQCARVRLTSVHDDGSTTNDFSAEECAFGNGHVERPFEVRGQAGAGEVRATLQTRAGGVWGNLGSQTVEYGPVIDTDTVTISRAEFDLGTGAFVGGAPSSPADLTWTVDGGSLITPALFGSLYAKNADDLCVRLTVKYSSDVLGLLETRSTTPQCLTDDDLHTFPIATGQYSNSAIDEVKYVIESTPSGADNWTTVGSAIAELS